MNNTVYLDITTIGSDENKEIVEITILDNSNYGEESVLFHSLVKPTQQISQYSLNALKINSEHLAQAPDFSTVYGHIVSILMGKFVVVYNWDETFDVLIDSASKNGLKAVFFNGTDIESKNLNNHKWNNDNLGVTMVQTSVELLFNKFLGNMNALDECMMFSSVSKKYALMNKYIYKNITKWLDN